MFSSQITHTASLTLTHCAFLCTVLSETAHNKDHLNLAFQIGMFGLEMARYELTIMLRVIVIVIVTLGLQLPLNPWR